MVRHLSVKRRKICPRLLKASVVIDETQVFQVFTPCGKSGSIQDQAVIPGSLGPLEPPTQVGEEAPIKRPPTPFGLIEALKVSFWARNRGCSGRWSRSWMVLMCRNTRLVRTNKRCRGLKPSHLQIPAPVSWLWICSTTNNSLSLSSGLAREFFSVVSICP